jgi:hypothetical protein
LAWGFRAYAYKNAHKGNKLKVAIAQNGIFLRLFAAATRGVSGLATTTEGSFLADLAGTAAF